MTCTHVLGLIDAGPFADYSRAHLDAAWRHARQCATCGPALEAAAALTGQLAALPEPAPPPKLASAVLARIARLEPRPVVSAGAAEIRETAAPPGTPSREWPTWPSIAGLAAGVAIVTSVSAGQWGPRPEAMSPLALTVGLALYAAGLFAPVRDQTARQPAGRPVP